jgi:hypothetical protein
MLVEPLLIVRRALREQKAILHHRLLAIVRNDAVCRGLMTVLGVAPLAALTYRATVYPPARFTTSKAIGAVLASPAATSVLVAPEPPAVSVVLVSMKKAQSATDDVRRELAELRALTARRGWRYCSGIWLNRRFARAAALAPPVRLLLRYRRACRRCSQLEATTQSLTPMAMRALGHRGARLKAVRHRAMLRGLPI